MKPFFFLVALSFATLTQAATLKFTGNVGYKVGTGNTTVTINFDGIANKNESGTSGTVRVQLWALNMPYDFSGTARGLMVGEFKLDGLDGGTSYKPLTRTIPAKMPSTATSYHMALIVAEYRESGFVNTDYRNFSSKATLYPAKMFEIEAPWSWQSNYDEGIVNMKVKKVKHHRSANTGSLKLELWACPKPYTSGTIYGVRMGSAQLKPLEKGFVYTDLDKTVTVTRPKAGTYHVVLLLLEYNNDKYSIVAHANPSKTTVFK
jgi:hypothetical protein